MQFEKIVKNRRGDRMRKYKNYIIPDRFKCTDDYMRDKQLNYCQKSNCIKMNCECCLFYYGHIDAFTKWYMSKNKKQKNKEEKMKNMYDATGNQDDISNPSHYTQQVPNIECIEVTQHFNFNRGNIIKYAWRCGDKGDAVEDMKKVIQYAQFEIDRLTGEAR